MRQASRICLSRSHPGLQTSARTLVFNAHSKPWIPASLQPGSESSLLPLPYHRGCQESVITGGMWRPSLGLCTPKAAVSQPHHISAPIREAEIRVGMITPSQAVHGKGLQMPAQQQSQPAHDIFQHCPLQRPAHSSHAGNCMDKGRQMASGHP